METLKSTLLSLIESPLAEQGYQLVDFMVGGTRGSYQIQVFIDRQGGILVDDCVLIDHMISDLIEARMPELQHYRLEVSSPGIDRPLKTEQDFRRNLGNRIRMGYRVSDKTEELEGIISEVSAKAVFLRLSSSEQVSVRLSDVRYAKIILE